jgi:hypothetical protein
MNVTLSQGVYVIACPHSTAALFGSVTGHIVYVHVIAIGLPYSCHRVLCTVVPVPVGSCVGTWFVSFKLKVSRWVMGQCSMSFVVQTWPHFCCSFCPVVRPQPQGYSKQNKTPELIASDCVWLRQIAFGRRLGWRGVSYPFWGGFPIGYVSWCISMYLACILIVSWCVPFIYIKIHRDTSGYNCICDFGYHWKCILPRDMYPSLRYIQDTFKIHLKYNVS